MHPTIAAMKAAVVSGNEARVASLLAPDVQFLPPTYWATWTGRAPVSAVLGHVMQVFTDFHYRRIMGSGADWALEFQCKIGDLDAVGVDLITLNASGQIAMFEVVMRPAKTIVALREAMNARVNADPRFLAFKSALS